MEEENAEEEMEMKEFSRKKIIHLLQLSSRNESSLKLPLPKESYTIAYSLHAQDWNACSEDMHKKE